MSSGLDTTKTPAAPQIITDPGVGLAELPAQPAFSALASDGVSGTAVLRDSTGSGGVSVKMAAAVYVLNLSFDIQAQALDLLV